MNVEEYRARYQDTDDPAPGWDAIDARLQPIYGDQQPLHWAPDVPASLGGADPIDGISAYACADGGVDHLHFVTYGYSNLYYDEEAIGGEFSKFGFEMTFRLKSALPPTEEPKWVCNLLQNVAKYVFKSGKHFESGQFVGAGGPIRAGHPTQIVGLAFLNDPTLDPIDTPHGRVEFVQAFGITQGELDSLKSKSRTATEIVEARRATNPLLVTDLERRDVA
ncbi:MAG TPA: suppressor of fused domain protein [Pirellulaceae bacterium]|jgi:hypothetical protein|nr:suppressor of fused domain protein [Pirellulaceae bacterium]